LITVSFVPLLQIGGAAFLLSLAATPLVAALAHRVGFLDPPGPRKIHANPVPYGGGLVVAGAVWAGLLVPYAWFFSSSTQPGAWAPGWEIPNQTLAWNLRIGSVLILALGLADDRYRLSPRTKLAVQTAAALLVALTGLRLELFDLPPALSVLVTVVWIVGVTNSFNLLDHMDGLCGGVAVLVGAALLWIAVQTNQSVLIFLLTPFVGACAGFLVFNFAPARIFLGDAGSLFIGFWLACLSVKFTFYEPSYAGYTYLVPLVLLAVPLYDTAGVLLIRLRNRKPLFQGDTNHLAHRLVALGLSRRQAVLSVYALTLFTALSAALLYHVQGAGALLVLGQLLLTFVLIAVLEIAGRRRAA
jgi:UDP-GlcNAc:undecaprenyl-phosphate GlcNAc-1-phosphate transferase